jgi:ATP-dependent DNA helicase Q4
VASSVSRLDAAYAAVAGAALYAGDSAAQEAHLRGAIRDYFGQCDEAAAAAGAAATGAAGAAAMEVEVDGEGELPWGGASPVQRPAPEQLKRILRAFLHSEAARLRAVGPDKLSGLAVARMLAGLASPAFPADSWRRVTEWGRLQAVDFPLLVAAANAELPVLWESS